MKKSVCLHWFLMMVVLASVFLGGCNKADERLGEETSVHVDKKGVITHEIIESFNKSYYDEDELKNLITQEISSYCTSKGEDDAAELDTFKVDDGIATAKIEFKTSDDYAAFNDVEFFYGTVSELIERGYATDVTLKNIEDAETIGKYEFEALGDSEIIVVSEPVRVYAPKKIEYITANIDVIDDNCACMSSESSGLGYIVLK